MGSVEARQRKVHSMNWEDAGNDRLFRPSNEKQNAQPFSIQDPIHALPSIAGAFSDAAEALFDQRHKKFFDGYACPIVYLYRHSVELYLKGIILQGDRILFGRADATSSGLTECNGGRWRFKKKPRGKNEHRLVPLLEGVERILHSLQWSWPPDDLPDRAGLQAISRWIHEIDELDPGSVTFRYPIARDGTAVLPQETSFDLEHFVVSMRSLTRTLYDLASALQTAFRQP
jgi:hypothetical protein